MNSVELKFQGLERPCEVFSFSYYWICSNPHTSNIWDNTNNGVWQNYHEIVTLVELQAKAKKNLLVILNRKDLKLNCKHSSKDFLCILRHEKKSTFYCVDMKNSNFIVKVIGQIWYISDYQNSFYYYLESWFHTSIKVARNLLGTNSFQKWPFLAFNSTIVTTLRCHYLIDNDNQLIFW